MTVQSARCAWWLVVGGCVTERWDKGFLPQRDTYDYLTTQDVGGNMFRITGASSCGDCPCSTTVKPLGDSADPTRRKKGTKPFCVKSPHTKPSGCFTECRVHSCSIHNGEGTERAEPGRDFPPSTAGSIHQFLIQKESVLKNREDPSSPECPSAAPSCPPGKVRFRECPPPPKLPKLPKCPPPCPPPHPPPVPECPEPPKCPPPCTPPQKSPSPRISLPKRKCSGNYMSTHVLIQRQYKDVVNEGRSMPLKSLGERSPVFQVAHRGISTSAAIFGSKNPGDGSSKCDKRDEGASNECSAKKPARNCAKPTKRNADCRKPKPAENCTSGCAAKPRCPPLPPPPPQQSGIQWSPPICSPPKLVGPSPCPKTEKKLGPGHFDGKPACPPPPPLPKPPCRPVCLCPCPPPPKLPPGSCPDVPTVDEPNQPTCPPLCPPKLLPPCPKDTWCPSKPSCPSKK